MGTEKECPFCSELIKEKAVKCRFCQSVLDGSAAMPGTAGTPAPEGPAWRQGAPIEEGTVIREYLFESLVGKGGMGEVYRATHRFTGKLVAVKVLYPDLMRNVQSSRRFVEEARVMADLDHPNIVKFVNFFEEAGRFFLVMEYIDGEPLEHVLEQRPLEIDEALRVADGVLAALEYAHGLSHPVIHRDVKPANIIICGDDRVVVADFGIARVVGRDRLVKTQGVVGTYEYMSPEQVQGEEVGPAADVYAFGVTLYRMLAGVVPFPQKTDTGIDCMNGHLKKPVPALDEYREGLPEWLTEIVEKALSKKPANRFQDAGVLREALVVASTPEPEPEPDPEPELEPVIEESETASPEASPGAESVVSPGTKIVALGVRPERNHLIAAAIAFAVLLALAFGFWLAWWDRGGRLVEAEEALDAERKERATVTQELVAEQGASERHAGAAELARSEAERLKYEKETLNSKKETLIASGAKLQEEKVRLELELSTTQLRLENAKRQLVDEVKSRQEARVKREAEAAAEAARLAAENARPKPDVEWVFSKPAGIEFAKHETTVAQFKDCVDAGACDIYHFETKSGFAECNMGDETRSNHPMNCVDWYGAKRFCHWAGGRLPSLSEWMAEATQTGNFPWGSGYSSCANSVMSGCRPERTADVCSVEEGNSASGLCDMVGNVHEWTESLYSQGREERMAKGYSAWHSASSYYDNTVQSPTPPAYRTREMGFRCVRDVLLPARPAEATEKTPSGEKSEQSKNEKRKK